MKILLRKHTRCFRAICLIISFLAVNAHSLDENPGKNNLYQITEEDLKIIQDARIHALADDMDIPENIHKKDMVHEAGKFLGIDGGSFFLEKSDGVIQDVGLRSNTKYVFVSHSMGKEALNTAYQLASQDQSIVIVFRGVIYPDSYHRSVQMIQAAAAKYSPIPRIAIDPTLFRKINVQYVPTIALMGEGDNILTNVIGHIDPSWLIQQYLIDRKDTYGHKGPSLDIQELDLIEVMQEKASKINWEEKKEIAKKRFWRKQTFYQLPSALLSKSRSIDPSVEITRDIVDANGKILVPMGTTINPLEVKSFNQALVVINPTEKSQLEFAKSVIPTLKEKYNRVSIIVTEIDRLNGWQSYSEISEYLDEHIFTLTPDVLHRFELAVVPSVITASDKRFFVEEYALGISE